MKQIEAKKETASLNTLSEIFDIPLWTLRKYASQRRFPGIIKRGRLVYVDIQFRDWLYEGEVKIEGGGKDDAHTKKPGAFGGDRAGRSVRY